MSSTATDDGSSPFQTSPASSESGTSGGSLSGAGSPAPGAGNLGLSWEIGVIVGIIVLVLAILGAVIFQRRRNQRRKREAQEDVERRLQDSRPRKARPHASPNIRHTLQSESGSSRLSSSTTATLKAEVPEKGQKELNERKGSS